MRVRSVDRSPSPSARVCVCEREREKNSKTNPKRNHADSNCTESNEIRVVGSQSTRTKPNEKKPDGNDNKKKMRESVLVTLAFRVSV